MATPVAISVKGADELRRGLRQADRELPGQLRETHLTCAKLVVARALPNVPIGKTRRLLASVRALASQRMAQVKAGSARVEYAAAIHWGRKRGNVGRPPGNYKAANVVSRRAFLWDATRALEDEILDRYRRDIRHLLDKAVRTR